MNDINNYIRVNRKGLFHSKNGKFSNEKLNAITHTYSLLSSAICVNEAVNNSVCLKILFNAVCFDGELYIVRLTVYDNMLKDLVLNRLKSIGIQKRNQPDKPTRDLLPIPYLISVKQLLLYVNELKGEYQTCLPLDVLRKLNGSKYKRNNKNVDIKGLVY